MANVGEGVLTCTIYAHLIDDEVQPINECFCTALQLD